jgi:chromate reductase
MEENKLRIVGISGSLRENSANTNVLIKLGELFDEHTTYSIFEGIGDFPFFSPEIEEGNEAVKRFRKAMHEADGVVICTPEYAFGMSGVLKNALDWLVSSGELNDKPVVALSASPLPSGGDRALGSLLNTLMALGTNVCAAISIPTITKKTNNAGMLTDPETIAQVEAALRSLLTFAGNPPAHEHHH